jgi:predicted GNAT family N-acyltransferase
MILKEIRPTVAQAAALRASTGWGAVERSVLDRSLAQSPHVITAWEADQLIGMVRTVGDGTMYLYIQDLIVDPARREQGVARALMDRIMACIRREAQPGLTVGLMAVSGLESFYAEYGFAPRPTGQYGAGMTLFL